MTDLTQIKQAARLTTDPNGVSVVQIPLSLWEDLLAQLEPSASGDEVADKPSEGNPPLGSLALLAKLAREAHINTGETDVSTRSREILEME